MEQLELLQRQIEGKLSDRTEGVDIGYWESLLSQLKAHTARGRLRDRHQQLLRSKLAQLKAEQLGKAGGEVGGPSGGFRRPPAPAAAIAGPSRVEEKREEPKEDRKEKSSAEEEEDDDDDDADEEYAEGDEEEEEWGGEIGACISEYNKGGYSPAYTQLEELPLGTVTSLEEEDLARRNFDQQKAMKGSQASSGKFFGKNS